MLRNPLALVLISLALLATDARCQPADSIFNATELLCVIEHLKDLPPGENPGVVTCVTDPLGFEIFILEPKWFQSLEDLSGCDCDLDFDGISGCEEILLCLNPGNSDTDGDCLADNLEILLGLDPTRSDTDGDGTADNDEDPDEDGVTLGDTDAELDGLTNCQEGTIGTNPLVEDTDGDGFPDGAEVQTNDLVLLSDPLDPSSIPDRTATLNPIAFAVLIDSSEGGIGGLPFNTVALAPPAFVVAPNLESGQGEFGLNTAVTYPPVSAVIPNLDPENLDLDFNTSVSFPPVTLVVPTSENEEDLDLNTAVSFPPVSVEIE